MSVSNLPDNFSWALFYFIIIFFSLLIFFFALYWLGIIKSKRNIPPDKLLSVFGE